MARRDWLVADLDGLAKTLARRGKGIIIAELLRNALDENVKAVTITLTPIAGRPVCDLSVIDDSPDGFRDLREAYTLFGESYKKTDATKAGRFNVGDKFVLAFCDEARITSTTGSIIFDERGRRAGRERREAGTVFTAKVRMTRAEYDDVVAFVQTIIVPDAEQVRVTFNGAQLPARTPLSTFNHSLPTEVADDEGVLRRRERLSTVRVYEPLDGERSTLYELGIPVMEIESRWHVDIYQKVPLTLERDAVPPSYLLKIRTMLLNRMQTALTSDDATAPWVREAAGSKDAEAEAVTAVMDLRFGERRVAYDPSDPEANKLAVAKGYTVVSGGSLSAGEWENVRQAGAVPAAGQVTPSPKPFSPAGRPLVMLDPSQWTPDCHWFSRYVGVLGLRLLGRSVTTTFANDPTWGFTAAYGSGRLIVNYYSLGAVWFKGISLGMHELLLHELAHDICGDHLSHKFHEAICTLGARLVLLAMAEPEVASGRTCER